MSYYTLHFPITTQEIFNCATSIPFPDATFDICERIAQAGPYPYVYFSPTCELPINAAPAQFGNAIFSKYPLSSEETIFTCGTFQPNMCAPDFEGNSRNAQFVSITTDNGTFALVNYHGYWEPNPIGSDATVNAMRVVAKKVALLTGPIIMAGDLNINPGTPAMRLFDGILEDLTATHHISNTLSELGKLQGVACDHILVNKGIAVQSFSVTDKLLSDHRGLLLTFTI